VERTGDLSARKAAIVEALVRHYIRTGEPIGSEAIAAATGLGVSSATIRNELAALEDMGYLTQPHTSAGRIPTDRAYRHYVDTLPRRRLRDPERRAIVGFFDEALADVDEILRGTTILLSRLTRYASLALAPSPRESTIARAELVGLGATTMLLVVFDTGRVDKRLVELGTDATDEDFERVSQTLAETVRGSTVADARQTLRHRMQGERPVPRALLGRVEEALLSMAETVEAEHVILGGAAHIAEEHAFHRRDTLRDILEALERESEILHLLREVAEAPAISVTIGRENPVTGIWEASVVAAPYGTGRRAAGTIGVVGPTRMDYATAISAVRAVAERLSAAVDALGA
jgi:heat-inducible transcriptional repressor